MAELIKRGLYQLYRGVGSLVTPIHMDNNTGTFVVHYLDSLTVFIMLSLPTQPLCYISHELVVSLVS